jgi:outer membrane receptor protein involved in Fe transport
MAITALGGEELKLRGVESIQDLSFAVPGLTMREDGPGSYTIFLRGLANQSGTGALVGVYLDEAPLSLDGFNQLSPVALDLARVEVLKGPQGSLYGQGSAGGTIRYITTKPQLGATEGSIEGSAYIVDSGSAGGKGAVVLNLPLSQDTLALRIAASYESGGGWIDQPEAGITNGNGTELLNVRGKLLWKPSDVFSAEAMVQIHRAHTKLGAGYEEADRTFDVGVDRSKVLIPKDFDYTLYNLELKYDLGFASLTSASTYIDHDHSYPFSYIPRAGNVFFPLLEGNDERYLQAEQFTQEVRLGSNGDGPIDWTIGAFYRDVKSESVVDYENVYGGFFSDNLYYGSNSSSESYSLFGDVALKATDRLTIGAGLRYFRDKQTGLIEYAPGTGVSQSATFSSVDPRGYISYKYNDNANAYASISKGFRSGGFNVAPYDPYEPEKILTYELGTKGAVADGSVQFDIAGFYTVYEDMVRRRLVPDPTTGGVRSESSNIGRIEVKGIEVGLAVRPIKALTLSASAAITDSKIVATAATDVVNIAGDRTDYAPKLSFTLGANYDFDWSADVPGFIRIDYQHRDKVTYIDRSSFLVTALPQRSDELDLINARIGAEIGKFGVELYGQNITNQNKSIDPYQGWSNANRTRPRVVGMRVRYAF